MKYTIKQFQETFKDNEACLEYVFEHRYGYDFPCPSCKKSSWHKIINRKAWACAFCSHQIHPLAGTIFHKSKTDLVLWFFAIYKFANSRNGVAAKELERDLGVTYKTAWRMAKQIRALMGPDGDMLSGTVEVDDAFIRTGKGNYKKGLTKATALVERGGQARAIDMTNSKFFNSIPLIKQEVKPGSAVMTDGAKLYNQEKLPDHVLSQVTHSKKEWARGDTHTNTVEGFFSQIKRSIDGTYHRVSEKHLQAYLDEFAWRLSHGRGDVPLFLLLLDRLCQSPVVKV